MEEKEMNESLRRAVEQLVPGDSEKLWKEPVEKLQKPDRYTRQGKGMVPKITGMATAAAALFLCILAVFIWERGQDTRTYISIDVNPGIELRINERGQVAAVNGSNKEGRTLVKQLHFEQLSMQEALDRVLQELYRESYFKDGKENFVLLSVNEKGDDAGDLAKEQVETSIRELHLDCEVIYQRIQEDSRLSRLAKKYQITLGKTALIERILSKNGNCTWEALSELNVEELLTLVKKEHLQEDSPNLQINTLKQKETEETRKPDVAVPGNQKENTGKPDGEKESFKKEEKDDLKKDEQKEEEDELEDDKPDEPEEPEKNEDEKENEPEKNEDEDENEPEQERADEEEEEAGGELEDTDQTD